MNKVKNKILAIVVAVIAVIAIIGAVFYVTFYINTNNAKVTVTYEATKPSYSYLQQSEAQVTYHSQYSGWITTLTFYVNFTSTKSTTLNIANFYLINNGQTMPTLSHDSGTTSITSGYNNPDLFTFVLEGNMTSYQLAYHGNNVNIIPESS
jgi:flagellar basal body-associated protein FliL